MFRRCLAESFRQATSLGHDDRLLVPFRKLPQSRRLRKSSPKRTSRAMSSVSRCPVQGGVYIAKSSAKQVQIRRRGQRCGQLMNQGSRGKLRTAEKLVEAERKERYLVTLLGS